MKKNITIIVLTIIFLLILSGLYKYGISGLLFGLLVYGGYIIKLIIYPVYIVLNYPDIIWITILGFFTLSIFGLYLLKRYHFANKYIVSTLILTLIIVSRYSSYYESKEYIKDVATSKYYTYPLFIHIDLSGWESINFSFTSGRFRSTYSEIKIDNKIYYWSFSERDFILKE